MKINTPLKVTALISLVTALILVACLYFVSVSNNIEITLGIYFLIFFIFLSFSAITTYILLEFFINRKIRLLFRMVQDYKVSNSDFKLNMSEDVLSTSEVRILQLAKRSSEELLKLKSEEKFRREFIGNLAHELKTPIFSIQGYILTLLEGGLEDPSVNRKFLDRSLKGVDRMNKIVMDLDMISRFESDRVNMKFGDYNLVELCQEIFDGLELKAQEKNISLKFAENYLNPIIVKCDRDKIGQVIQNLVVNAINYSDAGSEIIIRFLDIESNILIEVEDNGLGINQKHISRLFERFYRVDKSRARNEGGTGLGLSIVKHIVESHGHTVQVRSTEGEGSIFFFTLTKN
jgi:two-component system phosphate regulon sensor histidine kinase PhoR